MAAASLALPPAYTPHVRATALAFVQSLLDGSQVVSMHEDELCLFRSIPFDHEQQHEGQLPACPVPGVLRLLLSHSLEALAWRHEALSDGIDHGPTALSAFTRSVVALIVELLLCMGLVCSPNILKCACSALTASAAPCFTRCRIQMMQGRACHYCT